MVASSTPTNPRAANTVGPDDSGMLVFDPEPGEVWCENDMSAAVGSLNGHSLCATCIVPATAEAFKSAMSIARKFAEEAGR